MNKITYTNNNNKKQAGKWRSKNLYFSTIF